MIADVLIVWAGFAGSVSARVLAEAGRQVLVIISTSTVQLNTDYFTLGDCVLANHTVSTGHIDAFFDYCYGRLPYRSLLFEHQHLSNTSQFQSVGTINYPNEYDYTRITEFKHLTGQTHSGTSIVRDYSQAEGNPCYYIPRPESKALFKRYKALARARTDVTFVGRLAEYRYYNVDQVVGRC